jgi:Zn-dependent M28 family amino/carboxypeptidase
MTDDLARALGRAWQDDAPWALLTALTELDDRMAGHEGERRAAEHTADALADAGARDVTTTEFDLPVWRRGDSSLAVTEPARREFEALALPYSPAGRVESAPLVDVGHGRNEDFRRVGEERDPTAGTSNSATDEASGSATNGASGSAAGDAALADTVVLASTDSPADGRLVHRMEKYGYAVDAGAAGFIFYNHRDGQLPPTGALRFGREAEIPAVGVSKETGEWLREYADRDGRVTLSVDATTEPGTGTNTTGVLGPATGDEIVVLAHHDAHDVAEGALDNGCGVATLVAAARVLADLDLESRVRLATVGAEEVGLVGSTAAATRLDLDAVRAVVNVDGAGRYRTLRAFTHGTDAFADVLGDVSDRANRPIAIEDVLHPYSDHWPFLRRGAPAVQLHSVTPERGRGWGHTTADTRDKADSRNIREHGMLTALFVRELAVRDVPRPDDDALRETLADAGMRPGMEAADVWPAHWD